MISEKRKKQVLRQLQQQEQRMLSKKEKPINKRVIIYQGQSDSGLVKVIQNTLPNYERSKFLIQTTVVNRDNEFRSKIVAKSNDIRKVSELLSKLLGRKISLR